MTYISEKFLIDTNTFITPYKTYYQFDFAPTFWKQLKKYIENGTIILLDMVINEIQNSNNDDELTKWVNNLSKINIIYRTEIMEYYGNVLNYIQTSGYYKQKALDNWADKKIADAWLIAAGIKYGYTIITFESPSGHLSINNKSGKAKIPDVCTYFNVKCQNLFYMMKILDFHL